MPTKRLPLALLGSLFAILLAVPTALAFDIRGGDRIAVAEGDDVNDDLYAAGQTVTTDGTVHGDAVVVGQIVKVNGVIEGSLIAAAQSIIVNGTVGQSARLAAQAVLMGEKSHVGKDLIVVSYSAETRPGSSVDRDLGLAVSKALLTGNVTRNLLGAMSALELRGTVRGDGQLYLGDATAQTGQFAYGAPEVVMPIVEPGLKLTDSAQVRGTLTYTSKQQYPLSGRVGQVAWNPRPVSPPEAENPVLAKLGESLRRLGAYFLVGLLLLLVVPRWTNRLVDIMEQRPLPSLGWGLVAMLAMVGGAIGLAMATGFVATGLGALTLGSLAVLTVVLGLLGEAALITGAIAFGAMVAQSLTAYLGGHWLTALRPEWAANWPSRFIAGLILFVALRAIPVFGDFLGFAAAVLGFGALWIWNRELVGSLGRPSAAPAPRPLH
jgi:hypothetical protein